MKYKILVWMLINGKGKNDPLICDHWNEAVEEKKRLELKFPENIYQIAAIEEVEDV